MLICIDAGHYLGTPGKRCLKSIDPNETREWVLNSRVADKVQERLTVYDCQTMRVDDTTGQKEVTLYQRVQRANKAKADVYLSIHHNAGIRGGPGGGIVVYTCPVCQAKSKDLQRAVYDATVASTGLRGNRSAPLGTAEFYVLNNTTSRALTLSTPTAENQSSHISCSNLTLLTPLTDNLLLPLQSNTVNTSI